MIRVRYEKYYNDYRNSQEVRSFYSLSEVADWMFGMVSGDYKKRIYFTDPDYCDNEKLRLSQSSISCRDEHYHYWIEQIEKDGAIMYSCGTFTNGICYWNEEIKQWLRECRERVEKPQFNFAQDTISEEEKKMRGLEDFKLSDVSSYIINKIAEEKGVSKTLARKLFINAISYNVVVGAIMDQVDFLMEEE